MWKVVLATVAVTLALVALPSLAAKQEQPMSDEEVAGFFASTCGFCHQDGGREAGKGPRLMGTKRTNAFIVNRIKHGKEGRMPAFGEALTDAQIKSIVRYIRNLKPE